MPDQIYIGKFAKGLTTNPLPFNIDNDAFPFLYNFYIWRQRARRKRGTVFLGQLERQIQIVADPAPWQVHSFALVAGAGNLITQFSLGSSAAIAPDSISLVVSGDQTYTDPNSNGTLTGSLGGTGTIDYATGAFTVSGSVTGTVTGTFDYFPQLPVIGLRNFVSTTSSSIYPLLLAFDTTYSYQINQSTSPQFFYSTSYYKDSENPVTWSAPDSSQFWTTNYQDALWATNNSPGMQFELIDTIDVGSPTTITTATPHGLVTGDYVWFNEITGADAGLLNGQAFSITVTSPTAFTVAVDTTGKTINNDGIFQTLTATSPTSTGDGLRWYDGDPTGGTGLPIGNGKGWVNFAPPLTAAVVSINNTPEALYYLVGALAIVLFKDRLLFFNPWIQTSTGAPINLQDTVIWSWNGPAYYNALVPAGQTFDVTAYYVDQTGKGGYISAGISQPIITVADNEDVLLVGFGGNVGRQTRFAYTGNDLYPFIFLSINSELSSSATFSAITLDRGAITIGVYGVILTTQQSSERIDLQIPDSVFQIQALNNGMQRVNGIRDFFKEWIYFSYPVNNSQWKYPTQTFLYNYRDDTWAVFYENFTTHGTYRQQTKNTWGSIGRKFKSWAQWREPWNSGSTSAQFPSIVGGNPQGYVLIKGQGTGESVSGSISAIADSSGFTQFSSINHCVKIGDYLQIQNIIGSGNITNYNGQIGKVISTSDANTFVFDLPYLTGTYEGLGQYSRLSQPLLQTKQFPFYWDQGRQVRLSAQKYLMDYTANAQVTVNIYLSQDPDDVWNMDSVVPATEPEPLNNALVYSQIMYTCPESTNIGLTPPNTNLQIPTAEGQFQIWHRFNTSLIGDTFQVGITLSDAQMRNLTYATSEITLHGMHLSLEKGPHLA